MEVTTTAPEDEEPEDEAGAETEIVGGVAQGSGLRAMIGAEAYDRLYLAATGAQRFGRWLGSFDANDLMVLWAIEAERRLYER